MRLSLLAVAALCLSGLAAHADSYSTATQTGPFSANPNFYGSVVSLVGFDTQLGTLQSVTFSYTGSYTVTLPGPASAQGYTSALFVDLGPTLDSFPFFGQVHQYESSAGIFTFDQTVTNSSAATLAYFEKSGVFSTYFQYGDGLNALETSPGFTVDLTYTYTPTAKSAITPEPSTLALLGTGLVGLAGIARRRLL